MRKMRASRLAGMSRKVAAAALTFMTAGAGAADEPTPREATLRLEVAAVGVAVVPPPFASFRFVDEATSAITDVDTDRLTLPDGTPCPGIVTARCTIDIALVVPPSGTPILVTVESGVPGTMPVFSGDCRGVLRSEESMGVLTLAGGQRKICRISFAKPDTQQSGANAIVVVDKTFDFVPSSSFYSDDRFELLTFQSNLLQGRIRDDFRPGKKPTVIDPDPPCIPSPVAPRTECEWVAGFASRDERVRLVETAPGWFPLYGGDCDPGGSLPNPSVDHFYRHNLYQCSVENVFLDGGDADADGLLRVELIATAPTDGDADIRVFGQSGSQLGSFESRRMLNPSGQLCENLGPDLCTFDLGVSIPNGSGNVYRRVEIGRVPDNTVAVSYAGDCDAGGGLTVVRTRLSTCRITLSIVLPVVSVSPVSVIEGNLSTNTVLVPVSLNRPAQRSVTVPWSTSDGTATAPSDYLGASGSVTFSVGQSTASVPVTIVGDLRGEATESFRVDLGTPVRATLGVGSANVTIQNDDDTTPPVIAAKADVVVEAKLTTGQTVSVVYTSPRAVDTLDGVTAVTCAARSGSQFPLGKTEVRCSSTDRNFNTSSSTFLVVVRLPTTTGAVSNPGNTDKVLTVVSPGRRVRVTAGGFLPGSVVRLFWVTADGDELAMGSAAVDAGGRFDTRPKIPEAAPLGGGQILALGTGIDVPEVNRAWRLTVVP